MWLQLQMGSLLVIFTHDEMIDFERKRMEDLCMIITKRPFKMMTLCQEKKTQTRNFKTLLSTFPSGIACLPRPTYDPPVYAISFSSYSVNQQPWNDCKLRTSPGILNNSSELKPTFLWNTVMYVLCRFSKSQHWVSPKALSYNFSKDNRQTHCGLKVS